MIPYPVINQYANDTTRRKTVATIWGILTQQNSNLYASGLNNPFGPTGSTLTYNALTLIETDIKDFCQTAGSSVILRNNGTLWGCGDNVYGCLGFGNADTSAYLKKWTQMSTASYSGGVKKLGSNGSTISTFGIVDNNNTLWMSGIRTPMGNGATSNTSNQTTFSSVRSGVSCFSTSDVSFGIVGQTNGFAYATGIGGSAGSTGNFGNGRSTGSNSAFEGTPTTSNTTALNFTDVISIGGTTIGLTSGYDLYLCGQGWTTSSGNLVYTGSSSNHIYTFTKVATNVRFFAFGGSGGDVAQIGMCLAITKWNGDTFYIGTNYNAVAGLGSTYASTSMYSSFTPAPYRLRANSTFSWNGYYNGTAYYYSVYDTTDGIGVCGVHGTYSNTTGTMHIFLS